MDDYPTDEDEFELMYGDELELLRDEQFEEENVNIPKSPIVSQTAPSALTQEISQSIPPSQEPPPSIFESEENTNNKRSIDELFGDIDDILFENPLQPKRHKGDEHEADYALIEHIIQLRKLAKERDGPDILKRGSTIVTTDRDKNNLSYTVPNYPFIGVTRHDGERIYVRFHSVEYETEDRNRIVQEITLTGTLGSRQEMWDEAQKLINEQIEKEPDVIEIGADVEANPSNNKELWVDLYKPRKYFELLSDESTNRIMLRWLKLWDKVVFKRRPKLKIVKQKDETPFKKTIDLCTDLDEDGRPFHKVALLCGPPGLGKTTLAHMVARHAGYNVVEINASDDRSIDAFKKSLENATQMRSVIDTEKRPNCLIFDEIDGAPPSSIDYLVKFITGTGLKGKKNQQKQKNVLKRPIICICNDVYVPALRPLRQIAFVVNFPPTSNTRLAERLMEIARRQQVKTDLGAMLAMAEKSQNDIRSCLSVLHFFKSQNKAVALTDVHKASVGQKDTQKGLFSVWQDIFFLDRIKSGSVVKYATFKERMQNILNVVNSFGDYDKVAQGIFENYVNMKYKDHRMSETCEALEWFSYSDIINQQIYSLQNYTLSSYLQYAFVVWHFTFSSKTWQKLQYPNAGYETKVKGNRQKAIITEVMRGIQPSIRPYIHRTSLVLDILPMLNTIIVPSFRPINVQLFTEEEKKSLDHVVNVMIDYNLNYIQERTADGTYTYKLDPNLDEIVTFSTKKTMSYFTKQLIAKEIETEKMRRLERVQQKEKDAVAVATPLPNHLQTLKAKTVEMPVQAVAKDFFGRTITRSSPSASSSGKGVHDPKNDVWYQYKEGYSNAVRKKIKISTLK